MSSSGTLMFTGIVDFPKIVSAFQKKAHSEKLSETKATVDVFVQEKSETSILRKRIVNALSD